jgi:hypothetical protein
MTTPDAPILFRYTDGSILRIASAQRLIEFPVWEANRVLDTEHVRALESVIEKPDLIQGPFTVIRYKNEATHTEEWRVIDGQHRQEVIRRHFERSPGATDFPVLCRVYNTTDHSSAIKIFQAINNSKPMVYRGSPEENLHDILIALKQFFISNRGGAKLVPLIRPGANRPFLSESHLIDAIKRHGLHTRSDITPQTVVDHAEAKNAEWAADTIGKIGANCTQNMLDRATEYGFYLGLDPKCAWLQGL